MESQGEVAQLENLPQIQSVALVFDLGAGGGPHIADDPRQVLAELTQEVLTELLEILRTQVHLGPTKLIPIGISANIIAILIGLLRNHGINVVEAPAIRFPKRYGAVVVFRPVNAFPLHSYQLYQALYHRGYGEETSTTIPGRSGRG